MCCGYEPGNAPPCRVHNSPIFTVEDVTCDAMVNEKSRKSIDMWDPSDFGAPPRISSGLNVTDPPGPHPVYSFHLENGYCIGTLHPRHSSLCLWRAPFLLSITVSFLKADKSPPLRLYDLTIEHDLTRSLLLRIAY